MGPGRLCKEYRSLKREMNFSPDLLDEFCETLVSHGSVKFMEGRGVVVARREALVRSLSAVVKTRLLEGY